MVEVEQGKIDIIRRGVGQGTAGLPQHGGDLAEFEAKIGKLCALAGDVGKCDLEQRIEVEAGVALPRSQHLEIEPIAVKPAFDREIIDLLVSWPRRDIHRAEAPFKRRQAAEFRRHQRVGVIFTHLPTRIEDHAAGEGGHHMKAQFPVERFKIGV